MKKILFAFALIAAFLSAGDITAQNGGFYVYTGDAYVSTGMSVEHNMEQRTGQYLTGTYADYVQGNGYSLYSSDEIYVSFGIGYRFTDGIGLEVGVMEDVSHSGFRDYNNGNATIEGMAVVGSLYKSTPLNKNLDAVVSLSYRHLTLDGKSYYDFLLEPICLEYLTGNRHWGFRLSPFSIEVLSRTAEEERTSQNSRKSFNTISGELTTAINFNKFPIRVSFYF